MSSIGSVSRSISSSYASMMPPTRGQRPDPSKIAEDIFSKLDTKGQGYIEKSDLQNALSSLSGDSKSSTDASSSVDDLFSQLDSDSDGKVTKQELSDSMKSLADALDSQAMSSRMGMGGMPPPPGGGHGGPGGPGGKDTGLTKDELTQMASDVSSTDSQRASFMNDVADNFDKADADGDGKVTFKEAMAYEQSTRDSSASAATSTSTDASTQAASSDATQSSQARMMQQLMQLIHAYGDAHKESGSSAISATA